MTDNKSLESGSIVDHALKYNWKDDRAFQLAVIAMKDLRTKDLKKLSYHFSIPVQDLEKALNTKDIE